MLIYQHTIMVDLGFKDKTFYIYRDANNHVICVSMYAVYINHLCEVYLYSGGKKILELSQAKIQCLTLLHLGRKIITTVHEYFNIWILLFSWGGGVCLNQHKEVLVPPHPPSLSGPNCVSDTSVVFSSVQGSTQLKEVTQAH